MKQIKSHWKLAYRTTKKAMQVTIQVIINHIRLSYALNKFSEKLLNKRTKIKLLSKEEI